MILECNDLKYCKLTPYYSVEKLIHVLYFKMNAKSITCFSAYTEPKILQYIAIHGFG